MTVTFSVYGPNDNAGDPVIIIGPKDLTFRTDLASTASGKGAALVAFLQSGTGAVARTLLAKAREIIISPEDFGAVGDGVTSDRSAFLAMQTAAAAANAEIMLEAKTYNVGAGFTLLRGMTGKKGAKLIGTSQVVAVGAHNTFLRNIDVEGVTASGTISDVGIANFLYDDFEFDGGTLTNCRVTFRNQAAAIRKQVRFTNFTLSADFSAFSYTTEQLDPLYFNGYQNILIENFNIDCTNTHRIFKFSDTEAVTTALDGPGATAMINQVTAYRSRHITIRKGVVNGTTTSNKQFMDFYSGCTDVLIDDVAATLTGYATGIENKTTRYSATTDLNFTISNVSITTNGRAINFEGSFGSTSGSPSGKYEFQRQCVTLRNIKVFYTGTTAPLGSSAVLDFRFMHMVDIDGLEIINRSVTAGAEQWMGLELLSCREQRVRNFMLDKAKVVIAPTTTDQNGDSHTAQPQIIDFDAGLFRDYDSGVGQGAISLNAIVNASCLVRVRNVTQYGTNTRTAVLGLVTPSGCTLAILDVQQCHSVMNNTADNRVLLIGTNTIGKVINRSNSWNIIGSATATYDPPSVAAGALDTVQTITVTGANINTGQTVEATFTRSLAGMRLEAWVSASNTVSYRFSNPTAGSIDLASGTVAVRVLEHPNA